MFCPRCGATQPEGVTFCPDDGERLIPENAPEEDLLVGTLVADRYCVIDRLGAGGMGVVYRARQEGIGRMVALKVLARRLADDPRAVARFFREAQIVSQLRHPHTVTLFDFGRTDDSLLYMAMDLIEGPSLAATLRHGRLPLPRALTVIDQVCQSLTEAHAKGIVHRDIKPDNILFDTVGGSNDFIQVLDFGIAHITDHRDTLTASGMVVGTPEYVSPEQATGAAVDARADVYLLGLLLYHMIVGKPPFEADTPVGLLLRHANEPPPPLSAGRPDIDPRLANLVEQMLAKQPKDRPQSVVEVRKILEPISRDPVVPNPSGSPRGSVTKPARKVDVVTPPVIPTDLQEESPSGNPSVTTSARRRGAWWGIMAALLIGSLAVYIIATQGSHERTVGSVSITKAEVQASALALDAGSSDALGDTHSDAEAQPAWPSDARRQTP